MAWMYPDPKKTTSDDLDHALLQWSLCPFNSIKVGKRSRNNVNVLEVEEKTCANVSIVASKKKKGMVLNNKKGIIKKRIYHYFM